MSSEDWRRVVGAEATLLGPRLYEGMSVAIPSAHARARGLAHTRYPHVRPLLVRCDLREYLESEAMPVGWRVDGNPGLMGQLILVQDELGLRLRVLKERRKTYPHGVPPAGSNPARRREWQAALPIPQNSDRGRVELLLLWDYSNRDEAGGAFTLRIVHTTEAGIYGQAVRCDLDLEVVAGGTVFESLSFTGGDDSEDFFSEVNIDKAENDD